MGERENMQTVEIDASSLWLPNFRELWDYRTLASLLAYRNIRVRYKQAILGFLWVLLTPTAFTLIFLFFYRLLPVKASGDLPYVPVVYSGMILWQFISRALNDGGTSLTSNANIITKVYFPREIFPISVILAALFDFLISFVFLLGVLLWFHLPIGPRVLIAPLFVLWISVVAFSVVLWLSAIDGIFRDLRHALPLVLQLGMFICPVAYITSAVVPAEWMWLYEYNPVVAPIEGFRWALIQGAPLMTASGAVKSIIVTIVLLVSGTVFFTRMERTIVDGV
jgi:lipopolysaccharide transport system permease protein